jgi:hypothetical protein
VIPRIDVTTDWLEQEKTLEKPLVGKGVDSAKNNETISIGNPMDIGMFGSKNLRNHKSNDVEQQSESNTEGPRVDTGDWFREIFVHIRDHPGEPVPVDFDRATRELHKIVRHWLGLRQDCEDLLAQLRFLHETYIRISKKRGKDWNYDSAIDAGESFEVLISQCDICVRWTQVYHDRTQTRINMVSTSHVTSRK